MILEMFKLQEELNRETNGEDWREGFTKEGKIINWKRCIYMECAELIDSFPWKHWKHSNFNYSNLKLELVDIWHFVMSYILATTTFKEGVEIVNSSLNSPSKIKIPSNLPLEKIDYFLEPFEELMRLALTPSSTPKELTSQFFSCCKSVNLTLPQLYKLYIGKNILNRFRQDFGYKEGSYKKIWDGVEDNEVLTQLLEKNPSISPNALYQELQKRYTAQL